MKPTFRLVFVAILGLMISLPAYSVVYMEYSQAMLEIFTDSESSNRAFIQSVTQDEEIIFYAKHTGKGKSHRKPFGQKSLEKLKECFSQDELNDTCDENDHLERYPDSPIDLSFWEKLTPSSINVGILFTSYEKKMSRLGDILKGKKLPFNLLYHVSSTNKKLFYLSFGQIKNLNYLVGTHPFHRKDKTTYCHAKCSKGGKVDFLKKCFSGITPGFLQKVEYRYPNKPSLPGKYIKCPEGSSPPMPNLPRNLSDFETNVSETNYYRELETCWKAVGIRLPDEIPPNVGIKMEIDLTISPANPEEFKKLPQDVKKMLAYFAGVRVGDYTQSVVQIVRFTVDNCK